MNEGLVVPDTNVLLNLYRYSADARENLFQVLERLGDRVWFPHQVLLEFHRNREDAMADLETETEHVLEDLASQEQKALESFHRWANRLALPPAQEDALRSPLQNSFEKLRSRMEELAASERSRLVSDTTQDPILTRLARIVEGRRGTPFSDAEYATAIQEANRRRDLKIPPGFRDAPKDKRQDGDGSAGDYLVWEQALREAEKRQSAVLLVTGDVKPDWWRVKSGATLGPRNELCEELLIRAGTRLFMLRPESLLFHARQVLGLKVRTETLDSIERVNRLGPGEIPEDEAGRENTWAERSVALFMRRLDAEAPVQASTIRLAARRDGSVSREEVYSLAGYDLDRSLRGFTRPVNRITRDLQLGGILPYFAPIPLTPLYDPGARGYSRAVAFIVDPSFADVLLRLELRGPVD